MDYIVKAYAAFLLYLAQGMKPADAVEMAVIDSYPEMVLEKSYYMCILKVQEHVYMSMYPHPNPRVQLLAKLLTSWYVNFDAFTNQELVEANKYLDEMRKFFK